MQKTITQHYDSEARRMEYDATLNGEYVGTFRSKLAAEIELDRLALEQIALTGSLPADVAQVTFPAFARFAEQVEALQLPPVVLDLGAQLADELAAALALV